MIARSIYGRLWCMRVGESSPFNPTFVYGACTFEGASSACPQSSLPHSIFLYSTLPLCVVFLPPVLLWKSLVCLAWSMTIYTYIYVYIYVYIYKCVCRVCKVCFVGFREKLSSANKLKLNL